MTKMSTKSYGKSEKKKKLLQVFTKPSNLILQTPISGK